MTHLTTEELVEWCDSKYGGIIIRFSPRSFQTVVYFLREFAVPTPNSLEQLGAFCSQKYIVVGKRWFLEEVIKNWLFPEEHEMGN